MDELKQKFDERIRSLVPINGLAPQYQNELIQQSKVLQFKRRQHVFKQGDVDNYCYYLLEGELELDSNGQLVKKIEGGSNDARAQLAQLQPRQLSAKAKGKVAVLRAERSLLDRLLTMDEPGMSGGEMEVSEVDADDDTSGDWMTRMLQSELFARIPPANIQRVFSVMESVTVQPGEVVIEQDTIGDYYYIIQRGRCEVTRKTESSDTPIRLAELGDGDSFGEEALVSDAKRNATITMLTGGELMRLTKDDFVELIKKPSLTTVKYEQAKVMVSQGARWLDLRFPEEHQADGIEGSLNMPLNTLRSQMDKLDAEQTYIVYCDSGARSSAGTFLLAQNGFDAQHLQGGVFGSPLAAKAVPAAEPEAAEPPPPAEDTPPPAPPAEDAAKATPKPKSATPPPRSSPEVKVPVKTVEADVRASALSADIARAETKMEEALKVKAEAEAVKRVAAKKLKGERERIETEAAKATKMLEEAKRQRIELVKAKREAEAEAKRQREQEQQRLDEISQQAEERLRQEKANLEAEYKKQAEELAKLRQLKEKTKSQIDQERQALERQADLAKREALAAQQAKAKVELAEKKLRAQTEAKIRVERKRLEAEFARATETLAEAQQEREAAAAVREQVAAQAARVIAEQKAQQLEAQAQEEAKLRAERAKLQREAQQVRKTLKQAQRAKAEAEAAKRKANKVNSRVSQEQAVARDWIAASHKIDPRGPTLDLASLDAEVQRAGADLEAAEAAQRYVEEAQEDLEDTQRWKKAELEALRKQLDEELSDFRSDGPDVEEVVEAKKEAAEKVAYRKRKEAERKKQEKYNRGLLNDVESQLERD